MFQGNGSRAAGGRTRGLSQEPADGLGREALGQKHLFGDGQRGKGSRRTNSQLRNMLRLPTWLPGCMHPSLTNASDYGKPEART